MVAFIFVALLGLALLGLVVGAFYFAYTVWVGSNGDAFDRFMAAGGIIVSLLLLTGGIGLATGGIKFTSVPPGCYKVYDSSGTGVGVNSSGQVTTIVTSDRTYEPIPCPD